MERDKTVILWGGKWIRAQAEGHWDMPETNIAYDGAMRRITLTLGSNEHMEAMELRMTMSPEQARELGKALMAVSLPSKAEPAKSSIAAD